MNRHNVLIYYLIIIIGLILFPRLSPSQYYIYFMTQVLIFSIFCMGYNLLIGYTGMLSFGHASFFGLGAYGCALVLKHISLFLLLAILGGILLAGIGALIVGLLSVKRTSVYFAILTLAFAELIYAGSIKLRNFTGGVDGLMGIPRPPLFNLELTNATHYFYFVLFFFIVTFFIARQLVFSPFGQVINSIRVNEQRTELMGYNTFTYKLIVFMISGAYAGLAGALFSPFLFFVSPDLLKWTISGDVLLMTIVGGVGSLIGPILGACFIEILKEIISSYTEHWMIVLGSIYVIFVIFVPGGIVGSARAFGKRFKK